MTFVETAGLLAGRCEATGFAVLVDGVDDPVDARIAANGGVLGINEDHFEVLVGAVLVNPIRVLATVSFGDVAKCDKRRDSRGHEDLGNGGRHALRQSSGGSVGT